MSTTTTNFCYHETFQESSIKCPYCGEIEDEYCEGESQCMQCGKKYTVEMDTVWNTYGAEPQCKTHECANEEEDAEVEEDEEEQQ